MSSLFSKGFCFERFYSIGSWQAWWPRLAQKPPTGFLLSATLSFSSFPWAVLDQNATSLFLGFPLQFTCRLVPLFNNFFSNMLQKDYFIYSHFFLIIKSRHLRTHILTIFPEFEWFRMFSAIHLQLSVMSRDDESHSLCIETSSFILRWLLITGSVVIPLLFLKGFQHKNYWHDENLPLEELRDVLWGKYRVCFYF